MSALATPAFNEAPRPGAAAMSQAKPHTTQIRRSRISMFLTPELTQAAGLRRFAPRGFHSLVAQGSFFQALRLFGRTILKNRMATKRALRYVSMAASGPRTSNLNS